MQLKFEFMIEMITNAKDNLTFALFLDKLYF